MGADYWISELKIRQDAASALAREIRRLGLEGIVNLAVYRNLPEMQVAYDHLSYGTIDLIENLVSTAAKRGWIHPPIQLLLAEEDSEQHWLLAVSGYGAHKLPEDSAIHLHHLYPPGSPPRISKVTMELVIADGDAVRTDDLPRKLVAHIRSLLGDSTRGKAAAAPRSRPRTRRQTARARGDGESRKAVPGPNARRPT